MLGDRTGIGYDHHRSCAFEAALPPALLADTVGAGNPADLGGIDRESRMQT